MDYLNLSKQAILLEKDIWNYDFTDRWRHCEGVDTIINYSVLGNDANLNNKKIPHNQGIPDFMKDFA
jgi:hypothetical protein